MDRDSENPVRFYKMVDRDTVLAVARARVIISWYVINIVA